MKCINFHTHQLPEDANTLALISCVAPEPLFECSSDVWLSYGIHPWYIENHDKSILLRCVRDAAENERVLAIGEAGLDRVRGPAFGLQKEVFCQQIDISEKFEKPLIIHSVKANNEVLRLRKKMSPLQPWIIHGFMGHPQEMQQLTDAGFYLSFGPRILYPNDKVMEALKMIPENRFFLETDHTNKSIRALYEKAAEIRGISVEKLEEMMDENFKQLFGDAVS